MPDTTFAPGTVITNHSRLWCVDAHEGDVLVMLLLDNSPTLDYCPPVCHRCWAKHVASTPARRRKAPSE